MAVARKPPEAIPGALAGPGLMAQVIVSKGADHLPLHRLEGIFKRQGVRLSRQTMDGWWLQTAEFLRPLYALAIRVVLASHVIHTDDTSVKVRDAWQKLKHTGRFWPYVGDALHPLTVFDYTTTHQRDGPAAFLERLSRLLAGRRLQRLRRHLPGIPRADHRGGLLGPCAAEVPREPAAGCGSHGDGVGVDRQALRGGEGSAGALPGRVAEAHAGASAPCGSPPSGRSGRGRSWTASMPGWKRNRPRSCPRATVRGAMDYTLSNNWAALSVYPDDGWLDIDNNEGENSMRGLCLGRRNWLFCGSDRGGRAAAIHFSLLASCKRHGHDPWVYLRDVLTRLPAMLPGASEEELLALLPHRWSRPDRSPAPRPPRRSAISSYVFCRTLTPASSRAKTPMKGSRSGASMMEPTCGSSALP